MERLVLDVAEGVDRIAGRHAHAGVHCVFVDEAQFLEEEQVWQLARVADRLNIPVMCYGISGSLSSSPFSSRTGSPSLRIGVP